MASMARRQRIQPVVEGLLARVGVTEPPIPVESIAKLCGADIRFAPFDGNNGDVSGMLYQDGMRTIIGVNALHARTRQRFTMAHELGHLCLHSADKLHLDRDFRVAWRDEKSSQATDVSEIEANEFAAELLMPAAMLERDLHGHRVDYEDDEQVSKLATRYRVSLQAMVIRLTNLGLIGFTN